MGLPPIAVPYLAAVVVLGTAGVAKAIRPSFTANALTAAGLPATKNSVRAGAILEVGISISALVAPGPITGSLVAFAYAAFAAFVVLALQKGWPLASCGCFGRADTPPRPAHAVLNTGAAIVSAWWALAWSGATIGTGRELAQAISHQPWHGAPLVLVTAVVAGLAYVLWTDPRSVVRSPS